MDQHISNAINGLHRIHQHQLWSVDILSLVVMLLQEGRVSTLPVLRTARVALKCIYVVDIPQLLGSHVSP
jgi:hypothetical protein